MGIQTSQLRLDEILSMSPSRMVVTLYDETIAALQTAIDAIERGDIESRCNAVNLACEMVATLHLCLDMEKGGEVAENLSRLYGFVLSRMHRINLYDDREVAEATIRILMPLRDSWFELDSLIESGNSGEPVVHGDLNNFSRQPA